MPANGKAGGKAPQVGGPACAKVLMQDEASRNIVAMVWQLAGEELREESRTWIMVGMGGRGLQEMYIFRCNSKYDGKLWSVLVRHLCNPTLPVFLPWGLLQWGPCTSSINITWNLLVMQILGPHPRTTGQTSWRWSPSLGVLTSPPDDLMMFGNHRSGINNPRVRNTT